MLWLVLLFVALFVGATIVFWTTSLWQQPQAEKYLSFLGAFATLAVIFSFLVSLQNSSREEQRRRKDENERQLASFASETEKNWIDLEHYFASQYPYLTSFYKELYPGAQVTVPDLTPEQQAQAADLTWHASATLIQTIENIVNSQDVTKASYGWFPIFKSWLQSPTLRSYWNQSKSFYNPTTAAFIDGIINQRLSDPAQARSFLSKLSLKPG